MQNPSNAIAETTELRSSPGAEGSDGSVGLGPGSVLSQRFEIGALLGKGGMGSVYAARDRVTGRDVAIKVLLPELIASEHARERFMAEAVVSCDLSHPNIVRVHDVGVSDAYLYFSMERLRGQTLRERLRADGDKRMPLAGVTTIARQMIEALQYAQRFIVHRDIKPENTWLCADGAVKLMDFGIARDVASSDRTLTGMALGTPYYVAPEQLESAKHVDWRADQYSLGVMLYELLTHSLPMGVIKPLDVVRRDIPKRYAQAVMRAMSAKPEDRWPTWQALLEELTLPPRWPLRAATALGIAAVASAAFGLYLKYREPEVPEIRSPTANPQQDRQSSVRQQTLPVDASTASSSSEDVPRVSKSALVAGTVPPLSRFRDSLADGSGGPIMVVIPSGEFLMGSPLAEAAREAEEGPQHRVAIRRFALAQNEVSFDEYDRFAQTTQRALPNDAGWGRGSRPVINVSWMDATAYAEWLRRETGEAYRLPTEAEWEYAARAGTRTPFSTGNCITAQQANFDHDAKDAYAACLSAAQPSPSSTRPVGSFPANPFGLRDMHGNVYEWVADCYYEDYSGAPDDGRARVDAGTGNCSRRVLRGGSWNLSAGFQRSANRSGQRSDLAVNLLGFRLARSF